MSGQISITSTLGWTISGHARIRAASRGIDTRSILECIAEPELQLPGPWPGDRRPWPISPS